MATLTYAPAHELAALRFAQRVSAGDALRAIRRRMPAPLIAPGLDDAALRVTGFALALLPSAAMAWMFIAR